MLKLILNTLSLALLLFLNYWLNSGVIDGKTVGSVSAEYDTLFAPAGYAFAIWGLIYLGLIAFLAHQWYSWLRGNRVPVERTGPWFSLSNAACALWLYAWLTEQIGPSLLIMVLLLFSLLMIVRKWRMETWNAPPRIIYFVWWPIAWYLGWIVVATVANVSAWLVALDWDGGPLQPVEWTVVLVLLATAIYALLIYKRNLRESAFIGIWGLVAIAVRQWDIYPAIAWTAVGGASILFAYACWHGYKNRKTLPFQGGV